MKIILTSIGTRGDIEPFLAIGKIGNQMKKEDFKDELYKTIIE